VKNCENRLFGLVFVAVKRILRNICWRKTIKKIFLLILTIYSISLLAQPDWYREPKSVDTHNILVIGTGQGGSQQTASNNARSNLSRQLTSNIKIDSPPSHPVSFNENYVEYITSYINSTTEAIIRNAEILRQSSDGNTHYSMAVLNKNNLLIELENEILGRWEQTKSYIEVAANNQSSGAITVALYNLANAQKHLSELVARLYLYEALASKPYQIIGLITHAYIERKVIGLVGSITFTIVSGNQQSALPGTRLPEPIVFRASLRRVGFATQNIARLPVKVSYGNGTQIVTGSTNSNGLFSVNAIANPTTGNHGKIQIAVNTSMLPSYYDRKLRHKTGEAYFQTTNTDVFLAQINVRDTDGETHIIANSQVTFILQNHNVKHNHRAQYFIRGRARVVDEQIIEGDKPTQFISNVAVDLEYGIYATNRTISLIRGTGRGVSIRSFADAQNLAYQNLIISNREILLMIDRLENYIETTDLIRNLDFNDESIVISVGNPSITNLTHGVYVFREDPEPNMHIYEPNSYLFRPRAIHRRVLLDTYISKIEVYPEYIYVYFEDSPSGGRGSGSDGSGTWYPSGAFSPKLINLENNAEIENIGYRSSPNGYIVFCVFPNPRDGSFDSQRFSLTRGTLRFDVIDLGKAVFTPHQDR
jgi:hypothetical protein